MVDFVLNGKAVSVDVDGDTPLLWVLRDDLDMTGTKFGCGMGLCGACTAHVDGEPVRSCSTPVSSVAGKKVSTIEAMQNDKVGSAVQAAWQKLDVVQCGYCQSGQIMSATALLKTNPNPSDEQIDEAMSQIEDAAERFSCATRQFMELAAAQPRWGWALIRSAWYAPELHRQMESFKRADLDRGVKQGLFTRTIDPFIIDTILSMMFSRCASSLNRAAVRCSFPERST